MADNTDSQSEYEVTKETGDEQFFDSIKVVVDVGEVGVFTPDEKGATAEEVAESAEQIIRDGFGQIVSVEQLDGDVKLVSDE